MKKPLTTLVSIALSVIGLSLLVSEAHADAKMPSSIVVPGAPWEVDLIIIAGVIVGFIALISWLVIRAIRRKKNVLNK